MNNENGPESNDEGNKEVKKKRVYSDKPFRERRAERAPEGENDGYEKPKVKRKTTPENDAWDERSKPRENDSERPAFSAERRSSDRNGRGERSENREFRGNRTDRGRGERSDSRYSRDSRGSGSSSERRPGSERSSSYRGGSADRPDRRPERRFDDRNSSPSRRDDGGYNREKSSKRGDNWAPERRERFSSGRNTDDRNSGERGRGESNRDGFQRRKREDDTRRDRPERNTERSSFRGDRNNSGDDRNQRSEFRGDRSDNRGERNEFRGERSEFRGDDRRPERKTERSGDENAFRRPYGERSSYSSPRPRNDREGGEERRSNYRDNDRDSRSRFSGNERGERSERGGGDNRERSYGGERSSGRREGFVRSENYGRNKPDTFRKKKAESVNENTDGTIRLNKFISNSGLCSRREADELIAAGTVSVNGVVITEMGYRIKPDDVVTHEGTKLRSEKMVYILLNKPKDFITTTDDPGERKTVMSLVANACRERIYPVGRLDRNTTGLLLLTNDGELTKKLTHPSYKVRKIYHVELDKNLKPADMNKLSEGIELEDGISKVDSISYVGESKSEVGLELHSGKNRIVRRMFESLEYDVKKLDRVSFAGLTKKDLPRGRWRFLTELEVNMLNMLTGKTV